MNLLTVIYILNATFLILHEIESGYEKEWEILKLPGKITGFLLMHFPLIVLVLYGAIGIENHTNFGLVLGIITGVCGLIPFFVHKVFLAKKEHFNLIISNVIIYLNIITGIATAAISIRFLV